MVDMDKVHEQIEDFKTNTKPGDKVIVKIARKEKGKIHK